MSIQNYMVGVLAVAANVVIGVGTAAAATPSLNVHDHHNQTPSMSDAEAQRLAQRQREHEQALRAVEAATNKHHAQQIGSAFIHYVRSAVEQYWIIPPNAHADMAVTLLVQLAPSGEIIATSVASTSGDSAFDRSAQLAVEQAAPFSELRDVPAEFQRNLRQFTLRFTPPKDQ